MKSSRPLSGPKPFPVSIVGTSPSPEISQLPGSTTITERSYPSLSRIG